MNSKTSNIRIMNKNKKIKLFGGLFILTIVLFANLQISLNNDSMNRLLLLNSIESLAGGDAYTGYELRAGLCEDGTNLYRCEYMSSGSCINLDEDLCEPASSPAPHTNTVAYNKECALGGHTWFPTNCFKTCTRCRLTVSLCND